MNARQLIEAENPKDVFRQQLPRQPLHYRFAMAEGAFCFSVIAVDERQAVERANAVLQALGPSWELTDNQYLDLKAYTPEEEQATAENITTVDRLEDVFRCEPQEAVEGWDQMFKELTGG